jgi:hypothetical protein
MRKPLVINVIYNSPLFDLDPNFGRAHFCHPARVVEVEEGFKLLDFPFGREFAELREVLPSKGFDRSDNRALRFHIFIFLAMPPKGSSFPA